MGKSNIAKELGNEFEIEQYIHALGSSSTHVRYVMLAIIIAIVAAATTLWSSQKSSWEKARVNKFYANFTYASANGIWRSNLIIEPGKCPKVFKKKTSFDDKVKDIWLKDEQEPGGVKSYILSDKEKVCDVITYFKDRGVTNKNEAELYGEKLYEAYVNNMLYIHVPVLGTIFDVNDLGLITGVTFLVLMLVMSFYTHRAHENLAVCMWKVYEIAEKEKCFDLPGGKPNLLYHALAMQQVFTIPPTLARWGDNWIFRKAHYALFFLPFLTELAVTRYDILTADIGAQYSSAQTQLSLRIQVGLLFFVLFLCCLSSFHLYADEVLWKRIFLYINPAHRFKGKSRWIHWTHLAENVTPGWGLIVKDGAVFVSDTVRNAVWRVTQGSIIYHEKSKSKGLYLRKGEIAQYSLKPNSLPKFRRPIWWFQWWKSPISWSGIQPQQHLGPEVIDGIADPDGKLQVWEQKLVRNSLPFYSNWCVGGAEQQKDGRRGEAGFLDIRAIIPSGLDLFVTDGAWLRRIDEGGTVTTWGGRPLAHTSRREPPFLLGIQYAGSMEVQPEKKFEINGKFEPEILVCDFSTRRVFAVSKDAAAEAYKSKWGWTPSGIFVEGTHIYLLEYRRGFVWDELITSWQTTNHFLGHIFRGRFYARVLKFSDRSFSSRPKVIFKMTPAIARWAKNERRRAEKKRQTVKGVFNYDWRHPGILSRVLKSLASLGSSSQIGASRVDEE